MKKRLQLLLDDAELVDIQRVARERRLTTADWVRRSLREACASHRGSVPRTKLEAIATAAAYSFPVADVKALLDEIEQGRE